MYVKSWEGVNGLHAVYCPSPALKAVISLFETDNRYTDDGHARGGCIAATQALAWTNLRFRRNAMPPHPEMYAGLDQPDLYFDQICIEKWKYEWKKRLTISGAPWTSTWLSHQIYDEYFKYGSICEDYSRIKVPILAIGGWFEMHSNAVFRMCKNIPSCRGIIGPWSHDWPDVAAPGPNIGFMDECLDFWNYHLKNKPSAKQETSLKLTWYQLKGEVLPGSTKDPWPGRWCNISSFERIIERLVFVISDSGSLLSRRALIENEPAEFLLTYDSNAGLTCGVRGLGGPDYPGEQKFFNNLLHTWILNQPLKEAVDIFGFAVFRCEFRLHDDTEAMLAVKLCDVFPDGSTRLITSGVLNLTHKDSHENPTQLKQDTYYQCRIQLDAIGYQVLLNHTICVSVTPTYWPQVWPSRSNTSITIRNGRLFIPIIKDISKYEIRKDEPQSIFEQPVMGLPMDIKTLREPFYRRYLEYGLSDDTKIIKTIQDEGLTYNIYTDILLGEKTKCAYSIGGNNDPLSSKSHCKSDLEIELLVSNTEKNQKISIETDQMMTCDAEHFYLDESINVTLNQTEFFKKSYRSKIKRYFC